MDKQYRSWIIDNQSPTHVGIRIVFRIKRIKKSNKNIQWDNKKKKQTKFERKLQAKVFYYYFLCYNKTE